MFFTRTYLVQCNLAGTQVRRSLILASNSPIKFPLPAQKFINIPLDASRKTCCVPSLLHFWIFINIEHNCGNLQSKAT